jgi:(2Fe-2S) ferredoxin
MDRETLSWPARDLQGGSGYNRPMIPYERHVFICVNERDPSDPRGCCSTRGGHEVASRLKELAHAAGLKGRIRINKAGCLDQCGMGVAVVIYPEAVWYGRVKPEDADEIFHEHVMQGRPVERLRIGSPGPSPAAD